MLSLNQCPFHPNVTAVARKRPRAVCQKCRWQGTPKNTHTPSTQRDRSGLTMPLSRHGVGIYPEDELTRNLSGNVRPQSSHPADPLWTDSGIKSGISVREPTSTSKNNNRKRRLGMNGRTFSQTPHRRGKSHHNYGCHSNQHICWQIVSKTGDQITRSLNT